MPFTARTPTNALRQAVKYCKDNDIEAVGFDVAPEGIPENRRTRYKWLKERCLAKEAVRLNQTQQYVDYDASEAFKD